MQIMLENENTISSRMYLPKPRFKLHIIWDEQYTIWFIGTLKSLIILSSNKERHLVSTIIWLYFGRGILQEGLVRSFLILKGSTTILS